MRFLCPALVGVVAVVVGLALSSIPPHFHLIPANSLPPSAAWNFGFSLLSVVDGFMRALTPPNLYLFKELMGYLHTVEIYSAAQLSIADHIDAYTLLYFPNGGSSPAAGVPVAALALSVAPGCEGAPQGSAAECTAVALRLSRLLRACSAYGVFRETPVGGDAWVNTPASQFLLAAHPASLRPVALNFGRTQYAMMAALPEAIVGGEAAFRRVHGQEFWAWYDAHPSEHAIFDGTMNALGKLGAADGAIARDVPWGSFADVVVDVGGGTGEMAATILALASPPPKHAVIFDMAHVVARSRAVWAEEARGNASNPLFTLLSENPGLPSRVTHAAGDMFDASTVPMPRGGERATLMLRDILHDWPDEDCVRILTALRKAIAASGGAAAGHRVMIVGRMIRPGAGFIKSLGTADADMVMLGAFGTTAGERTLAQHEALLAAAGLKLISVTPTRSQYFIYQASL